jgi:hypothetical protein
LQNFRSGTAGARDLLSWEKSSAAHFNLKDERNRAVEGIHKRDVVSKPFRAAKAELEEELFHRRKGELIRAKS